MKNTKQSELLGQCPFTQGRLNYIGAIQIIHAIGSEDSMLEAFGLRRGAIIMEKAGSTVSG